MTQASQHSALHVAEPTSWRSRPGLFANKQDAALSAAFPGEGSAPSQPPRPGIASEGGCPIATRATPALGFASAGDADWGAGCQPLSVMPAQAGTHEGFDPWSARRGSPPARGLRGCRDDGKRVGKTGRFMAGSRGMSVSSVVAGSRGCHPGACPRDPWGGALGACDGFGLGRATVRPVRYARLAFCRNWRRDGSRGQAPG
jgi:hypothetical protein